MVFRLAKMEILCRVLGPQRTSVRQSGLWDRSPGRWTCYFSSYVYTFTLGFLLHILKSKHSYGIALVLTSDKQWPPRLSSLNPEFLIDPPGSQPHAFLEDIVFRFIVDHFVKLTGKC